MLGSADKPPISDRVFVAESFQCKLRIALQRLGLFDGRSAGFFPVAFLCTRIVHAFPTSGYATLRSLGRGAGPEAKGEFSKRLKAKKVRGVVMEKEAAGKLTDRQLAAKVQKHFAASSAKKTAAPDKDGERLIYFRGPPDPMVTTT